MKLSRSQSMQRSRSGLPASRQVRRRRSVQPPSAHQQRGRGLAAGRHFDAPEIWHPPVPQVDGHPAELRVLEQSPGVGYVHAVSADDVRERVLQLPAALRSGLDVVQLSRMTRKRQLFPCYGLQWGSAVYLDPIEESLEELYIRVPRPAQRIETEMYGGRWVQDGRFWRLIWTAETVRDFYLNNVLMHEIGHINDARNTSFRKRERYADWFAIEYGYRATR
ncbi:MAG: hypothetical protein ACK5MO_18960 [Planctomyces sp.]